MSNSYEVHARAPVELIFVTQLVDPDDDILGFVLRKVTELSRNVERLVVVANEVRHVPPDLGAEVYSLGKERGWSRARRTLELEGLIAKLGRGMRRPVLLAHMCPEYVEASAPLCAVLRIPIVMWFTHPRDSARLGRALRLSRHVLTALPGSFPRAHPKVQAIGHAIDMSQFAFAAPPDPAPQAFICVGRTSPVKGYPTVVHALALARAEGVDARLTIVGSSSNAAERDHRRELERLIDAMQLGDHIALLPGVPHEQVADLVRSHRALISATDPGSADKAVFEAMACGRPTLVSNPAFAALLERSPLPLRFDHGDAASLAARIAAVARLSADDLVSVGSALREAVESQHSVEHWARQVAAVCAAARPRARATSRATWRRGGRGRRAPSAR